MIGCEGQLSIKEELFKAISCNNRTRVMEILNAGFDVNTTNDLGQTPIYVAAAIHKNLPMVRTLAHFNPDFERKSDLGYTPLSRILLEKHKHADLGKVLKIIKTLLESGAKLTTSCSRALPLHIAIVTGCHTNIIRVLLTEDTVNAADPYGYPPLHLAILYNCSDIAKVLIEYQYTDINIRDEWRNTPLILATKMDNQEIVDLLLAHGADRYLKDSCGGEFLKYVIPKGKVDNLMHNINGSGIPLPQDCIGISPNMAPPGQLMNMYDNLDRSLEPHRSEVASSSSQKSLSENVNSPVSSLSEFFVAQFESSARTSGHLNQISYKMLERES